MHAVAREPPGGWPARIVSPKDGTLHVVAHRGELNQLAEANGLRQGYLADACDLTNKPKEQTLGWQPLWKVRWLQHKPTSTIVVVVGGPLNFFNNYESICSKARISNAAPLGHLRNVRALVADEAPNERGEMAVQELHESPCLTPAMGWWQPRASNMGRGQRR